MPPRNKKHRLSNKQRGLAAEARRIERLGKKDRTALHDMLENENIEEKEKTLREEQFEYENLEMVLRASITLFAQKDVQKCPVPIHPSVKKIIDRIVQLQNNQNLINELQEKYKRVVAAYNKTVPKQRIFSLPDFVKVQKCIDVAVKNHLIEDWTDREDLANALAKLPQGLKNKNFTIIPMLIKSTQNFKAVIRIIKELTIRTMLEVARRRKEGRLQVIVLKLKK